MAQLTIGKYACTTSSRQLDDGRHVGKVYFEASNGGGTSFDALVTGISYATADESEAAALEEFRRGMTLGQLKF